MDIAGAKALKERLGQHGGKEDSPEAADVPEHAPPVYHYLGVAEEPESSAPVADEAPLMRPAAWARRLGRRLRRAGSPGLRSLPRL